MTDRARSPGRMIKPSKPYMLRILIGCCLLCAVGATAVAAGVIVRSDGVDIHDGPWHMRVTALADDILRVRAAAAEDLPEDASWAVPQEIRGRSVQVSVKRDTDSVEFHTAALSVRIELSPLRIIVSDLQGHVISADAASQALEMMGSGFILRKQLAQRSRSAKSQTRNARLMSSGASCLLFILVAMATVKFKKEKEAAGKK